jgi:hypothetical protein
MKKNSTPRADPALEPIDAYFAVTSHVSGAIWLAFGDDYRLAALNTATRQIEVYLGEEIPDETKYRYAVYEQALHVARNSGAALDFDQNRPAFIPPDGGEGSEGESPTLDPSAICQAAIGLMTGLGGDGKAALPDITLTRA